MKINKLELVNFRCFEDYEITLSDRFTLLIGDNGSGKTTVLDGLAFASSVFLLGLEEPYLFESRSITPDDIHYNLNMMGQTLIKESESSRTIIRANGAIKNKELMWALFKDNKFLKSHTEGRYYEPNIIDLVENLTKHINNPNTKLPIITYYSTKRLWKLNSNKEYEILSPESRLSGYQNCLNPSSDLERIFRWFKTQELAALQKKETRHILEAVRAAIISMIPDAKNAWWDVDWDELLIKTTDGKNTPFHLLSDGYRNMLGMVADIAYRMAKLNPQLEADVIKQTEGIVLIDEIDLHLHPKWQRQVVGRLLDTFPKVQFVASSHSPFIIQSLYHRDDVLLWDLETAKPLVIESKSIEDIAENQQGVEIPQQSQRFLDMEKAAEKYYTALKQIPSASEEEKAQLKQHLDELLFPYSDDPAFQALLKIERYAAENSNGA